MNLIRQNLIVAAIVSLCGSYALAQSSPPTIRTTFEGLTPKGLEPGAPAGSYALSGFDSVSTYSGNMSLSLPLVAIGGRGEAGYMMHLPVSFKWESAGSIDPDPSPGCSTPCRVFDFIPDWWGNLDFSYRPAALVTRSTGEAPGAVCPGGGAGQFHFATSLTRMTVKMADGSEMELRDLATGGEPKPTTGLTNCLNLTAGGFNRGRIWVATDGSASTFIANNDVKDYTPAPSSTFPQSGVLYLRNGLQYHFTDGLVTMIRDRNGNRTTFQNVAGPNPSVQSFDISDPLGRTTRVRKGFQVTDPITGFLLESYDEITFPGTGGNDRKITVKRRDYWLDAYCGGGSCGAKPTTFQLFGQGADQTQSIFTVSSVILPDNRSYKFFYNQYAEPARVVLPTGGAVEYSWANGINSASSPLVLETPGGVTSAVYRRMIERREYVAGGSGNAWTRKTTYETTGGVQNATAFPDPELSGGQRCATSWCLNVNVYETGVGPTSTQELLSTTRHYFYGAPEKGFFLAPYQYSQWSEGRQFATEVVQSSVIQTEKRLWAQRATPSWWNPSPSVPPKGPEPGLDVRIVQVDRSGLDGKVARTAFQYYAGNANNQSDVDEFDFGATAGTIGPLLRRTHTDFETNPDYVNVIPGGTPFVNSGVHLRSLPLRRVICLTATCDAANYYSKTLYEMDGTPLGALVPRASSTPGYDASNYGDSFTFRGNSTSVKVLSKSSPGAVWLVTNLRFDVLGNIVEVQDPNTRKATIEYDDRVSDGTPTGNCTTPSPLVNTFAFRTKVTNPAGWTNSACYDYKLGKPVRFVDPNGIKTNVGYEASGLDRLKSVVRAPGLGGSFEQSITYDYGDAIGSLYVRTSTSQLTNADQNLKTQVSFDGFGRKVRTATSEDGTFGFSPSGIFVDTIYDGLGRAFKTSNPYRPSSSPVYTTQSFDALGRVTKVTHPDNSVAETIYSGITTQSRDEACKARDLEQDALGRLKKVREDSFQCGAPFNDATPPVNYETTYTYNVQDLLTKVVQGVQVRDFTYDLAGRLKTVVQPESGLTSYEYDNNGNVLTSSDARTQVTSRTYDILDRLQTITSPDGFGGSATDRLCYDGQVASATNCSGTTSIRGPLTSAWSAASSSGYTPDQLGRITASSQLPSGATIPHTFSYTYNADGSVRIFTDSDQQSQLNPIGFLTGNRSEFSELSDQRFHGKPIRDWEFVRRVIGMK